MIYVKGYCEAGDNNDGMGPPDYLPAIPPTLPPALTALELVARIVSALESTPLVAVCSIDREGVVRFCNAYCAALCALPSEQVVGRKLAELLSRGERQEEHERMLFAASARKYVAHAASAGSAAVK